VLRCIELVCSWAHTVSVVVTSARQIHLVAFAFAFAFVVSMPGSNSQLHCSLYVQATAAVAAPGGSRDAQESLASASQHVASAAAISGYCAQISPAQVTFISSAANMAPLATRKAALVRFREKKARSHFAPKV
jgi:hypothetical protein